MTDYIDALFLTPAAWSDKVVVEEEEGVQEHLHKSLKALGWERPTTLQMPGTRVYQGRKLVHAKLDMSADAANVIGAVVASVPGECVGALGRTVPATKSTSEHRIEIIAIEVSRLLNWMADVIDEEGTSTRPTKLALHTFAGRGWHL